MIPNSNDFNYHLQRCTIAIRVSQVRQFKVVLHFTISLSFSLNKSSNPKFRCNSRLRYSNVIIQQQDRYMGQPIGVNEAIAQHEASNSQNYDASPHPMGDPYQNGYIPIPSPEYLNPYRDRSQANLNATNVLIYSRVTGMKLATVQEVNCTPGDFMKFRHRREEADGHLLQQLPEEGENTRQLQMRQIKLPPAAEYSA